MNNIVCNNTNSPIYIYDVNSSQFLSNRGSIFGVTVESISLIGINDQFSVKIQNPSDSTKTLYISDLSVSTTGTTLGLVVTVLRNGTHSGGTPTTPLNFNFGSTNTSEADATYSTNGGTGGDVILFAYQTVSLYNEVVNNSICLPPNSSLVLNVLSTVALVTQTVEINIIWSEI